MTPPDESRATAIATSAMTGSSTTKATRPSSRSRPRFTAACQGFTRCRLAHRCGRSTVLAALFGERVGPAEFGEAGEVRIGRAELQAMLQSNRRKVGIRDELRSEPIPFQQRPEDVDVSLGRLRNPGWGSGQPGLDDPPGLLDRCRTARDPWIGADPHECGQRLPGEA